MRCLVRNRRHNIMKSCKIHFIHYDRKGINCEWNFTTCVGEKFTLGRRLNPDPWGGGYIFLQFFYHPNKRSWLSHLSYCREGLHNSPICGECFFVIYLHFSVYLIPIFVLILPLWSEIYFTSWKKPWILCLTVKFLSLLFLLAEIKKGDYYG